MQQAKIDAQKIITVEGISDGKFKVGIFRLRITALFRKLGKKS